ncbi:hypothetical protein QLQ12_12650 [Actinoplanes sp. NEAU-A12]|uniref:Uncharacterized protein n=1 Tax=Actinoplanes sandaracinus TaxID=3045177 RepID=A0ABT6WIA1_9ACTN|nr:hypothetical protein [Actinoplanes sandaracinus]MDI6099444.1 hypothetical protein [Actinoplanes sandaracinus]
MTIDAPAARTTPPSAWAPLRVAAFRVHRGDAGGAPRPDADI